MRKTRSLPQQELPLKFWGGARKNAGRKPNGERAGASHLARPRGSGREPIHVGLRLVRGLPDLQRRLWFRVVVQAFERAAARRDDFRVTHYSVQGNHLHLIGEAETRATLSRAMRSLNIRVAKGLNELMRRARGRVIADRYHVAVLDKPQLVRNAVRYVLSNTRKHLVQAGKAVGRFTEDAYAAGPAEHVPGVMRLVPHPLLDGPLVQPPRSWLLREGWRRAARRPALAAR